MVVANGRMTPATAAAYASATVANLNRMARDWETWLKNSIGPASDTEEADRDRTEQRIRAALLADTRLAGNVRIFVQGSYANNTNVRRDSDVDIAVEWKSWSYLLKIGDAAALSWDELGVPITQDGPTPGEYRRWIEEALVDAFGGAKVDRAGNKAIPVEGGPTTLDADVVPCFKYKRYSRRGTSPDIGIKLYPKNGGEIVNWPEQNLANGIEKNRTTGRRYKQIVRALKRLENDMLDAGLLSRELHGYFLECLLFNLRNDVFMSNSYKASVLDVLATLWTEIHEKRHEDWVEVNRLKWLWRSGQTWSPDEAAKFAHAAWNYIKSG